MNKEEKAKKISYLKSYKWIEKRIKNLEGELERVRLNEMMPSAKIGDGMPHGSGNQRDLSDYAVTLENYIKRLEESKKELYKRKEEIQRCINRLEPKYAFILEQFYIDEVDAIDIGAKIGYEKTKVYEIRNKALELLKIPEK